MDTLEVLINPKQSTNIYLKEGFSNADNFRINLPKIITPVDLIENNYYYCIEKLSKQVTLQRVSYPDMSKTVGKYYNTKVLGDRVCWDSWNLNSPVFDYWDVYGPVPMPKLEEDSDDAFILGTP